MTPDAKSHVKIVNRLYTIHSFDIAVTATAVNLTMDMDGMIKKHKIRYILYLLP
jgi:hypothetical protein